MTRMLVLLQLWVSAAYIAMLPPWPPPVVVELPCGPWQLLPVQVRGSVTLGAYEMGAATPVALRVTLRAPPVGATHVRGQDALTAPL